MRRHPILILGGTTEARAIAAALGARPDCDVLLSLAGRTASPRPQPVATRSGGFGGAEGLAAALRHGGYRLLIDATHPFAARISDHAAAAAAQTGIAAIRLSRPAWERGAGDDWIEVGSVAQAVEAIGPQPRRVFLAIGRQEAAAFEAAPQHAYLIRSVDPVDPPPALPDARFLLATGPFEESAERRLLETHRIEVIVTKNSGGAATYGKILAARALGLPVIMVARPKASAIPQVETVEEILAFADHVLSPA